MANEDVLKDFGKWTTPKSWDDITLKTYQEIERFYTDKDKETDVREIVHILCGKTVDEVNALPFEFFELILEKLAFISKTPEVGEPTNKIVIDGETYSINVMEKLKTGEWVAADTVRKNDPHNYAAFFAILCRKEGEIYDSKFEAELFEKRVELFEKQPVIKILPIIAFFLNLLFVLETPSKLYTQVEETTNHILNSINNSQKIGLWKKFYMKWQVKKLRKSLRSNNNTSQTSSRSLLTSLRKVKWKKKKISTKKI